MHGEADFIPFAIPDIGPDEIAAVVEAMQSGWLTTGPRAAAFEREFAAYLCGDVHAIAVSSATAGMHLALEALGIRAGDEVIVPAWTFTATAEVVRYLGAQPVVVDVDRETLNIDFDAAETAVTSRTRAVMPVHFAGLPVARQALSSFASQHGLSVVEDAAHAFPAKSEGALVGVSASDAVVFSFYATKTITTGEGGMLVTHRSDLAERARVMRLHGITRNVFGRYRGTRPSWRYDVAAPGFKYNLTDTAAAMGRVQLRRAEDMRARRQQIAELYNDAFGDLPIQLPAVARSDDLHSWHLYVLRLSPDARPTRDEFIEELMSLGVGCSVHFIPLHLHPYWRTQCELVESDLPVASAEFQRVVSLPIFSGMSDQQVERVISSVRKVLG